MTAFDFLAANGRLPRLGDSVPPWKYRGWLLPYVARIHEYSQRIPDRWGYYLRTLEAGKLMDEPIPPITFDAPNQQVFKDIANWTRIIGWDCCGWSDFRTLLDWLSWGLGLSKEEARLADDKHEKLYRTVNLQGMVETPHDYLGDVVAMQKAPGWNPTAFFPTPHSIVECMVRMLFPDDKDTRTLSVCDPCVGSGRMLLHASNYSLNLWGQDIDPIVCAICRINGALYAPWLAFPLPAAVLGVERPALKLAVDELPQDGVCRVDAKGQLVLF